MLGAGWIGPPQPGHLTLAILVVSIKRSRQSRGGLTGLPRLGGRWRGNCLATAPNASTSESSLISKKEAPAGCWVQVQRNGEIDVFPYFRGCVCTACW